MPDVSPTKWHLAHTTWFFETFILQQFDPGLSGIRPGIRLFVQLLLRGGRSATSAARARLVVAADGRCGRRLSRPCQRRNGALCRASAEPAWQKAAPLIELGLHHEQQHQELILMDIKHVFSINPLLPAYQAPHPQMPHPRRRTAGSISPAGSSRSAIAAMALPSTTRPAA